ncbi:MAG: methyltransferase, partial [Proteobacteria bacterium]|nr:methyltransferase [Pseudomonadota bacterium]
AACGGTPPRRIVDFGAGSGCLLVALLHEFPDAWGVGVDVVPGAAAIARANAEANGVAARAAFVAADWGAPLTGRFDLVVANPPYVASADIDGLAPEVAAFDPRRALDGGPDGLEAIRGLAPHLARVAAPGAHVLVEVGEGQAAAAAAVLAATGLKTGNPVRDLAGHLRVVTAHAGHQSRG